MLHGASDRSAQSAQPLPDFLTVGRVLRPHGVRGALWVEAFSEHLPALQSDEPIFLQEGKLSYRIKEIRPHRKQFLLMLQGVDSRELAENLRGMEIMLPLKDVPPLPEDVYYHWQIIGLDVVEENGESLGTITQILETGANDVYVVQKEGVPDLLLPAIESVILQVDLENGLVQVRMIPGLRVE